MTPADRIWITEILGHAQVAVQSDEFRYVEIKGKEGVFLHVKGILPNDSKSMRYLLARKVDYNTNRESKTTDLYFKLPEPETFWKLAKTVSLYVGSKLIDLIIAGTVLMIFFFLFYNKVFP